MVALNDRVGRNVLADPAVVPKFRILGRNVLADLALAPKFQMFGRNVLADAKARTFGRSVRAVLAVVLKFRAVVRNAPLRVQSLRTFDRNGPEVLVLVPKSQALDLNGLRLVHRLRLVQDVLKVHNDPEMQLARVADIVTRQAHVRITLRDSNPATQIVRVVDIVTRLVRVLLSPRDNNRSRRPRLGQRGADVAAPSLAADKVTRASAIALSREDDLGRSENARC